MSVSILLPITIVPTPPKIIMNPRHFGHSHPRGSGAVKIWYVPIPNKEKAMIDDVLILGETTIDLTFCNGIDFWNEL